MPLRDHFRPPVSKRSSWEGFHGYWPAAMVKQLGEQLPDGFIAEPRVHLGNAYEIDINTYEESTAPRLSDVIGSNGGGVAIATYAPPEPSLSIDTEIPEQYEYEVLIYDVQRDRTLVAAIEIVSPGNKDRPENRHLFVAKCASLLQKGVCVSIVDLVTIRKVNLYAELLELIGCTDQALLASAASTYAVVCRTRSVDARSRFEVWSHTLAVGQTLPTLPIWLNDSRAISLNLEACYEETCRVLRIS